MGKALNIFCASGGGSKGAFEGGVLQAISEREVELHAFVGVSTGAVQAGYMALAPAGLDAQRQQVARLRELWFSLAGDSAVYSKPPLGIVGILARLALGRSSLYTFDPLEALLDRNVTTGPQRPVRLGAVELDGGSFVAATPDSAEGLRSAILTSCSIPVFFPPTPPDRVDGGVRNIAPLPTAFDLARDLQAGAPPGTWDGVRIYVALASPRAIGSDRRRWATEKVWTIGLRSLDILEGDNYEFDVAFALETNDLIGFFERHPEYERPPALADKIHADIYLFEPDEVPYSGLEFDHEKIQRFWQKGYDTAMKVLDTGPLRSTTPR